MKRNPCPHVFPPVVTCVVPVAVILLIGSLSTGIVAPAALADEIDPVLESFVLATDREQALEQLVPGTPEFYYYHCLHLLNTQQFDQVSPLLDTWIKRHRESARTREIRNRLALSTYALSPAKTLAYLRNVLHLHFDHQMTSADARPDLPTRIDPKQLVPETLTRRALERHKDLSGFEARALPGLVGHALDPTRRRQLLERLERPDVEGLPGLVVADLREKTSRGFGSLSIHSRLLLSQLDACLDLEPELLNQPRFVNIYAAKLRPSNDTDITQDVTAKAAYLDRLWGFVDRLAPAHNSLKAHVLYHRLDLDRRQGTYDKKRFLTYLALPRRAGYMNRAYMQRTANNRYAADLSADCSSATGLAPVGRDDGLVRDFLGHFFVTETSYDDYAPFINEAYLRQLFAETKIVNGLGDAERWAAMLPPEKFQVLKERVDLDFDPANSRLFDAGAPVSLDLYVKNVSTLIVKIFSINTRNYYRQEDGEIQTDLNLDGLVPNDELTFDYQEPPLRRVRRHFSFPQLAAAGTYVVDFIGNGKASRALVRKGDLRLVEQITSAGHLFTVFDEKNRPVIDAVLWVAGREIEPDESGRLIVPFTTEPSNQSVVVTHGDLSVRRTFRHRQESYRLVAGIHVDREALIAGEACRILVRPRLMLAGEPVTLSVLEDVTLVLKSTDHDGVTTTKTVRGFDFYEDRETVYAFKTPPRLAELTVSLTARVPLLSLDGKQDLSVQRSFTLNGIEATEKTEDIHLIEAGGGWFLDVLGNSGEVRPHRPVRVRVKHRDYTEPVEVLLQSDDAGRVGLGPLEEISWIKADGPGDVSHTWTLPRDRHTAYRTVHAAVGEPIEIPFMGGSGEGDREALTSHRMSLLETRGGTWVRSRFDALSLARGFLTIRGLEAGDYDLIDWRYGNHTRLRVGRGERRGKTILGPHRLLEVRGEDTLQIASVCADAEALTIQLSHASPFTRVHIFADRYQPAFPPYDDLALGDIEPRMSPVRLPISSFVAGRNIGDEYRYIIDRRYAKKWPGNMLARPSLLLNPWAVRGTETGEQRAREGGTFGGGGPQAPAPGSRAEEEQEPAAPQGGFSSLEFLAESAALLVNLRADEDGRLTIPRGELGAHQQIHIVAIDPLATAYRRVSLDEPKAMRRDLRLAKGLDSATHYGQRKLVSILDKGEDLTIEDFTTSRIEAYDSLQRVFGYYISLTGNENLAKFEFVSRWPRLTARVKKDLYSRFACHELNFFLYHKDRPFFDHVVRPYLANKKDKTFLDRWLLGADLSAYLDPWRYGRLNVLEKILLARRLTAEREATAQEIRDRCDLNPSDLQLGDLLFETALKGRALELGQTFGLEKAKENLGKLGYLGAERKGAEGKTMDAETAARSAGRRTGGLRRPAAKRARGAQLRDKAADFFAGEESLRAGVERFYRKLDKTKEWAENNYFELPIERQGPELVGANAFWKAYAEHDPGKPFLSAEFVEAHENFTEMMCALAVLDLPFASSEQKATFDGRRMTLRAAGPMVLFHEEIQPLEKATGAASILVSQSFYRMGNRYRFEGNERVDNYVTDEFLAHVVYGCQIVVTNPTSSAQQVDVLLQIPEGSVPVLKGRVTRNVRLALDPYRTQTVDYFFYFPATGRYRHYPVQVAAAGRLLAGAAPFSFNVVERRKNVDRGSWDYVSQRGSLDEVLEYLGKANLQRTALDKLAFRMKDRRAFDAILASLTARHGYDDTLWSYAVFHDDVPRIREFLEHQDGFVQACGAVLTTPLLEIDPVVRSAYQHLEYRPLVNTRAHRLGPGRQILNDRFHRQYHQLLRVLTYRPELRDDDLMALVYYLLLQDRVGEAMGLFGRVNPGTLDTRLQYDYFTAYFDFFDPGLETAKGVVARYADYPVDRWRQAFAAISAQVAEVEGAPGAVTDAEDRDQVQAKLAEEEASFDFSVESQSVRLDYQNLSKVQVSYYLMDLELLFSRNPFVQEFTEKFAYIRPNLSQSIELPEAGHFSFPLPEDLQRSNVLVEITGAGKARSRPYYANALGVQVLENYGQVRVTGRDDGKPLPAVYVKAYAELDGGEVVFYKDGYTDLRGRFDYASTSTDQLDRVERFALLVTSEDFGSIVREARPPKR